MNKEKMDIEYKNPVHINIVSTYPKRGCGIGDFNWDFLKSTQNITGDAGLIKSFGHYPIIRPGMELEYNKFISDSLEREIIQDYPASWNEALRDIREKSHAMDAKGLDNIVMLQHEFGLYADHWTRDNAVNFVKGLYDENIANVIVLHTLKKNPSDHEKQVISGMMKYTDKGIVLSRSGPRTLRKVYGAERGKAIYIPHGVPEDNTNETKRELKEKRGLLYKSNGKERKVLTSAGYISRGKGLHYMIRALPDVINTKEGKGIVYLVAGDTHPEVFKDQGDKYWQCQVNLARNLKIPGAIISEEENESGQKLEKIVDLDGNKIDNLEGANIVFWKKRFTTPELMGIMKMSDVGMVGNLDPEQISSGPGAYWIGNQRTTIATESTFFKDLEDEGIGLLVGFHQPKDFADRMNHYLRLSVKDRKDLRFLTIEKANNMQWEKVARNYVDLMRALIQHRKEDW
ncbi:hypothetical protein GOV14_04615 [Candidatus Pacearchaeota archaeon]|nr:hypothetical protein [Candidatus Pacearchaeota archaeon]